MDANSQWHRLLLLRDNQPHPTRKVVEEQRRSIRIHVDIEAHVQLFGISTAVRISDMSRTGLYIKTPIVMAVGALVDIAFDMPREEGIRIRTSAKRIVARARVVRFIADAICNGVAIHDYGLDVVGDYLAKINIQAFVLRSSLNEAPMLGPP